MLNCAPHDSSFILYTLLFNSRRWYWWYLTVETVEVSCGALLRRVYLWIHPKKNKNNFSHLKINCEKKPERTLWERVGYTTQQLCLNHKAEEVFFSHFLDLSLFTAAHWLALPLVICSRLSHSAVLLVAGHRASSSAVTTTRVQTGWKEPRSVLNSLNELTRYSQAQS